MWNHRLMALAIGAVLLGAAMGYAEPAAEPAAAPADSGERTFVGKVMPLAVALEQNQATLADGVLPSESTMALVTDDGHVYVLQENKRVKAFVLDERLRDRPMQLTAAVGEDGRTLQTKQVMSLIDGKLHTVEYWCENCQLSYFFPGNCYCCGNPTELLELLWEPEAAAAGEVAAKE